MKNQIIAALEQRYATKKFDPTKKITNEELNILLDAIRLTPTSYGLQLMKVVVVNDQKICDDLVSHSYDQMQVKDAGHLIVLCKEKNINESHIDAYIDNIALTRGVEKSQLEGYRTMMLNTVLSLDENGRNQWMEKQVYIALGNLMTVTALMGIDACPMEGFLVEKYNEILGLDQENLSAVLTIPLGYRSNDDKNATLKKVRRSISDFVIYR